MKNVDLSKVSDEEIINELHKRDKYVTIKAMETDKRFVAQKTWDREDFVDIAIEEKIPEGNLDQVVDNALKFGGALHDCNDYDWDCIRNAINISYYELYGAFL